MYYPKITRPRVELGSPCAALVHLPDLPVTRALPTLQRYLDGLPRGVDSYPSATAKGAIVRAVLGSEAGQSLASAEGLPQCVRDLMEHPPAVAAWVPETHYVSMVTALHDHHFAGNVEATAAWAYEENKKLLSSPLYRVMFLVLSPERMFLAAGKRWGAFHRGSVLEVVERKKHSATMRLTYPAGLMNHVVLQGHCSSFRGAGEAAGARLMRVRHEAESDSAALYDLAWV
jgi:hypothetical protein